MKLSSESAVEKITLDGVRGLRVTLSATVHDVLYYMSPIHCQDIIDSVFFSSLICSSLFYILFIFLMNYSILLIFSQYSNRVCFFFVCFCIKVWKKLI